MGELVSELFMLAQLRAMGAAQPQKLVDPSFMHSCMKQHENLSIWDQHAGYVCSQHWRCTDTLMCSSLKSHALKAVAPHTNKRCNLSHLPSRPCPKYPQELLDCRLHEPHPHL